MQITWLRIFVFAAFFHVGFTKKIDEVTHGEYTYLIITSPLKSFDNAEADCVSRGGHLTSVHDDQEMAFLTEQLVKTFQQKSFELPFWIGLFIDIPHNGPPDRDKWKWTDGTPFDYTEGWGYVSFPEDARCAMIKAPTFDGWYPVRACNDNSGYVCKKGTRGAATTETNGNNNLVATTATPSCDDDKEGYIIAIVVLACLCAALIIATTILAIHLTRNRSTMRSLQKLSHLSPAAAAGNSYNFLTPTGAPHQYTSLQMPERPTEMRGNLDNDRNGQSNSAYIEIINH